MISGLRLDAGNGAVMWRSGGKAREARVTGARDVRAEGDRIVVLIGAESGSALAALDDEGREIGRIAAPKGILLSHFGENGLIVGQGEAPAGGWWDWHFEVDWQTESLRRAGPAY